MFGQLVPQPVYQLVFPLIDQSFGGYIHSSFSIFVGLTFVGWSFRWSIRPSVPWLVGACIGPLVAWSLIQLVSQLVD